jgi:O-antigen ligase
MILAVLGLLSLTHVSDTLLNQDYFSWILLACVSVLTLALRFLPVQSIVLLLLAAIPLDPNATVGFLPKLSALDYFSAAAGIALLTRESFSTFVLKVWRSFPLPSIICWILFFTYAGLAVYFIDGQLRGTLRWGEFLFYYVLTCFALEEDSKGNFTVHIAKLLSVMAAIISLITIIQFSYANGNAASADATFRQRNVMAAFLSLCLPACGVIIPGLEPRWILLRKVASFLTLCAFILSYSRGAWIGLTTGILIVVWGLRHKHNFRLDTLKDSVMVILLFIGPLAAFLIVHNPERPLFSVSGRPMYWEATLNVLKKHPLVGMGPGNYNDHLQEYLTGDALHRWVNEKKYHAQFWQHLHSLYFQVLVEYGIVGFLFWAGGIGFILLKALKTTFKEIELFRPFFLISVLAYLTHNLVDMLAVNSLDLIFVILLAITANAKRESHSMITASEHVA